MELFQLFHDYMITRLELNDHVMYLFHNYMVLESR